MANNEEISQEVKVEETRPVSAENETTTTEVKAEEVVKTEEKVEKTKEVATKAEKSKDKKKKAKDNQYVVFHTLKRCFKLLEESEVVLKIIAEVTNLPLEHCDTLDTHSECEAAVLLAVDA